MKKRIVASALSLILAGSSLITGIQVKEVKAEEVDTLNVFINMPWYPIDSFTGIIPDLIKEKTGVDLEVTVATDTNQLGVMISAGELPDLIFTHDEGGALSRLSNSKICYSYPELEEYGADFSEVNEENKNIAKSFSEDDSYYTLLNNYSTKEEWDNLKIGAPGQAGIFVRQDIMDELGNPKIESMEDFMNVLAMCKENYPDMVPLGLGGYWKSESIKNEMGLYKNQYDAETGEYYYEASAPGYKEFLQTMNEMARKGYITAEAYATESESDTHQTAYNNGCVFYTWYLSYSNLAQLQRETQKIHPEAEWRVLPYFGEGCIGNNAGTAGCFVSKNCSNPEAAARLLTYLHSQEGRRASLWGREGVEYTLGDDGVPVFSQEYMDARDNGELYTTYNTMFYFGSTLCDEIYMNFSGVDQATLDDFYTYSPKFVNYPELGMAKPVSSSNEGVIYTKLEDLRKNYEAKVIFAGSDDDFEKYYDEYMEALEKTGVQEYNDYMKESIQESVQELEG